MTRQDKKITTKAIARMLLFTDAALKINLQILFVSSNDFLILLILQTKFGNVCQCSKSHCASEIDSNKLDQISQQIVLK